MNTTSNCAKYHSKNIFVQIGLRRFFGNVVQALKGIQFNSVIDVGCGEGFVGSHLRKVYKNKFFLKGVDKNYEALQIADSVEVFDGLVQADIYQLPFKDVSFDLVVCTEVLEHLLNVESALQELKRISRKYCLLSVPAENYLRFCRILGLKNVACLGRHPEHLQSFSRSFFCSIVNRYFNIQSIRVSFPWIIILGSK
ncbi:MAG: class I SAM-dependent methyltransferase [Candidatus Omnitrophica bacterium]|nr:class I SAM-dependent methyltransferase [Candidatus Omnitrophota bacterium]